MIRNVEVGRVQEFIDYVADVAEGLEDWLDPEIDRSDPAAMAQYLARGAAPSAWAGSGAAAANLEGPVELHWIKSLSEGRDPITGEPLGREIAVAGCEFTIAPPKSVSAYAAQLALDGDATANRIIDEVLDEAAARSVDVAEQLGVGRSRTYVGSGVDRHMVWCHTSGLIVVIYSHETNYNGDPHKHRHMYFLNRTQRIDGAWRGIDTRALYGAKAAMVAEARAIFNQRIVERLGVTLDEDGEITTVPAELCRRWSSRDEQVQSALEEWLESLDTEISDNEKKAAAQRIAGATRKGGGPGVETRAQRHQRWRTERDEVLATRRVPTLEQAADLAKEQAAADAKQQYRLDAWAWPPSGTGALTGAVAEARAALLDTLKTKGMWQRRQIWAAAAKLVPPGADARWGRWLLDDALEASVDITRPVPHHGDSPLYDHHDPNGGRWQHPDVWQAERTIDAAVRLGRDAGLAVAAAAPGSDGGLDEAQAAAVDAICASGDEISLVVGPAGAGKTTMMRAAAARWSAAGYTVTGLATAAKAAAVLKAEAGLNDALTVAKALHSPEQVPRGGVLVLDEAGMTATLDMAAVVELAQQTRSKLVLVGDPEQLPGIGAAGMFRHLVANGAAERLGRSRRHANDWENINSERLREGDTAAVDTLAEHGRIIPAANFAAAAAEARARYRAALDAGETFAATAATRAEVWALNLELRRELPLGAELGRLHRADLDTHTPIAQGDIIATGRNAPRITDSSGATIKNGERWRVLSRTDAVAGEPAGLKVESLERPGATAELPGEYVTGANADGRPWIEHANATTVHRTQGATVDRSVAFITERTDRPGAYVPLSRGRLTNHAIVIEARDQPQAVDALKNALRRLPADVAGITYTATEHAAAALPHHDTALHDAAEAAAADLAAQEATDALTDALEADLAAQGAPEGLEHAQEAVPGPPQQPETPQHAPQPDSRAAEALEAASERERQARRTRSRALRTLHGARSGLKDALDTLQAVIEALRMLLEAFKAGFEDGTLTAEARSEARRAIADRFDEYRQALEGFDAAKAGLERANDSLDAADAGLREAAERLAAAHAELTDAAAGAAAARSHAPASIDTTAPVWDIDTDLRLVEADIDELDEQLQSFGITHLRAPPSAPPPAPDLPEPDIEPQL